MLHPTDASPPIAELARVHVKAQPGQAALHDVSLAVRPGEILTLLGAGGAQPDVASGTGTVLALFAGFCRATTGQVTLGGRLMKATPTYRRDIGMVSRKLSLFPNVTVAGHAGFSPGVTPAQANATLQLLDLSAFARRLPDSLPPEIQVRVALARALARSPKLLLLDYQLSALPPAIGTRLKALLRTIVAETGLSILHATDDVSASYGLCDRIGVIQAGQLRQIGRPQELYDQPNTLAVAAAMGPLNRLAGTVVDSEDDIARIRLAGGAIVEARTVEDLADGAACVVALRPERIAVAALHATDLGDGAVPARLVETVFAGDQMRLRFSLDQNGGAAPDVVVTRPSGAALPRSGAICLAWQPHHAHAFRTEPA